ncbi:AzlD domain-containing protein [Paenibacillus hunanensis]|uniref:AzlD domain-containing protein n=1 Tax=Paenibacillus hunanensis TaxID=539262 RepID=UPI002025C9B5|nr:AzlD domain-containing protein [Paenibacillus hunanensis]MCL9661041.1 AzlD domain-containing protein [Paenibacillus hunanensis]WPP42199.1 AzlD domain-containing protein [Paenibacillus hunanensis]
MTVNWTVFMIIVGCALVTMIPRVAPFFVVRNMVLPQAVMKWLSYIPVCIFTALVVESMLDKQSGTLHIEWPAVIVLVPTLLVALKTKSLSLTVVVGVVCMAVVRFFW